MGFMYQCLCHFLANCWVCPPASFPLIWNFEASFWRSLLWRPIRPRRWRTFMWKVMVTCGIMSSQERLLLYLDLIYRPCHLRKPTNLLTQGKEAWFGQRCLQIPLWRQSAWSRAICVCWQIPSVDLFLMDYFLRFLIEAPFSALAGVVADARDPPKVKCAFVNRLIWRMVWD